MLETLTSHATDTTDLPTEPAGSTEACPGSCQPVEITFASLERPETLLGMCEHCPHRVLVDERCMALPHDTHGHVLTQQCRS